MPDSIKTGVSDKKREAWSQACDQLFVVSRKLRSFSVLLVHQGRDAEAYSDLEGLGMVLNELSDGVEKVWKMIDQAGP
jgi:hypothetical protein